MQNYTNLLIQLAEVDASTLVDSWMEDTENGLAVTVQYLDREINVDLDHEEAAQWLLFVGKVDKVVGECVSFQDEEVSGSDYTGAPFYVRIGEEGMHVSDYYECYAPRFSVSSCRMAIEDAQKQVLCPA